MASLAETLDQMADSRTKTEILGKLDDRTVSAASVAYDMAQLGIQTSERSVRRYRHRRAEATPLSTHFTMSRSATYQNVEIPREEDDPDTVVALKKQIMALHRKVEEQKGKTEDYVAAVREGAFEAISLMDILPVPEPGLYMSGAGRPEVAVAVLGDWQLGKKTRSYNSAVAEQRIELYGDKVIELTNIQRAHHPVDELHVFVLGDIVEGELIFPGQQWLIDASLYQQVTKDGPRILANFLRKMVSFFDKVTVHAIIGNHGRMAGRSSGDMNGESNADRMVYTITRQLLEYAGEKRIEWNIPDGEGESNWYAIANIGNYSSLLLHGDQFRGASGIPVAAINKKVAGWAIGAIPEHFDDVDFGHYHTPTRLTVNRVTARCVGSPESDNGFAQEVVAAVGQPSQALRFVEPQRGIVTAEYVVWLTDEE